MIVLLTESMLGLFLLTPASGAGSLWWLDADSDGFGDNSLPPITSASQPPGHVDNNSDCDDSDPEVYPGNSEVCNGLDDNCDGQEDEGLATQSWYPDGDGDLYGDANASPFESCANPGAFVLDNTDCDDGDAMINPGAYDFPGDGIDSDCDGVDPGVNDCANATVLAAGLTVGSSSGAPSSFGLPGACPEVSEAVWYALDNPGAEAVQVRLSTTSRLGGSVAFESLLAVFRGPCGALVPLECSADPLGAGGSVTYTLEAGETSRIALGAPPGGSGGAFALAAHVTSGNLEVLGQPCPIPGAWLDGWGFEEGGVAELQAVALPPQRLVALYLGAPDIAPFGVVPGSSCEVTVLAPVLLSAATTSASGNARFPIGLPTGIGLAGFTIGLQVLAAGDTPGEIWLTNGIRATVGG